MNASTPPLTVDEARDCYVAWLDETRGLSDHTVRAYRSDVSALARSLGGETDIGDLCPGGIRRFFDQQRRAGLCSTSLRRRAAGIRGFCAYLDAKHLVDHDSWPADSFAFTRTRSLPKVISGTDLSRLLGYLMCRAEVGLDIASDTSLSKPGDATTLLATAVMLNTGVRVGELVSCRTSDVNLTRQAIQVLGKGRRERVVYLTDEWLMRLTKAYLVTRMRLGVEHNWLLFNASFGRLSTSALRARLAKAGRAAGLNQHLTPHMLRHSAATQLIESGVSIRFVQRLLGHASITTTEIYTHVTDEALQQAVSSADVVGRRIGAR